MHPQQQYDVLVDRLNSHCYDVLLDGEGYIVQHQTDSADVSHMRDLNDLVDFADLIDWAADWRRSSLDRGGFKSQVLEESQLDRQLSPEPSHTL